MKIRTVEINMEAFGAEFAVMDDRKQAAFFKGMARELQSWKSNYHAEMQFHSVAQLLSQQDKDTLERAISCIYFKETT